MTPLSPQSIDVGNPGSAANRDETVFQFPFPTGISGFLGGGAGSAAAGVNGGEAAWVFSTTGATSAPQVIALSATTPIPADAGNLYEVVYDVNLVSFAGTFTGISCRLTNFDLTTILGSAVSSTLGRQTIRVTGVPTDDKGIAFNILRNGGATGDLSAAVFSAKVRKVPQ